eukprot:SAG11_NODE_30467_length_300_cov_2.552239_1_plen_30_part_01
MTKVIYRYLQPRKQGWAAVPVEVVVLLPQC